MAENTRIEWTDDTWSPITGCSVVSPGCTNCYAMKLAGTRLRHHPSRTGLTVDSKAGPVWNGQVRFNEQWLDQPMRCKRPRMIFVCAHGDLFHENVPDEWIDRVFAVMALSPQHTFQVLTKRSARMREYLSAPGMPRRVYELACDRVVEEQLPVVLLAPDVADPGLRPDWPRILLDQWPLPNVWLGVSAEDQPRADDRIPDLLATPAAVRFLSAEPLLGPIDLTALAVRNDVRLDVLQRYVARSLGDGHWDHRATTAPGLDWVIVGGESGHGARPMHPEWARSLCDQCARAGVPFFFKQWGNWLPLGQGGFTAWSAASRTAEAQRKRWMGHAHFNDGRGGPVTLKTRMLETQHVLTVGQSSGHMAVAIGKEAAGRLLDGVEHNGMPQPREVPAL